MADERAGSQPHRLLRPGPVLVREATEQAPEHQQSRDCVSLHHSTFETIPKAGKGSLFILRGTVLMYVVVSMPETAEDLHSQRNALYKG